MQLLPMTFGVQREQAGPLCVPRGLLHTVSTCAQTTCAPPPPRQMVRLFWLWSDEQTRVTIPMLNAALTRATTSVCPRRGMGKGIGGLLMHWGLGLRYSQTSPPPPRLFVQETPRDAPPPPRPDADMHRPLRAALKEPFPSPPSQRHLRGSEPLPCSHPRLLRGSHNHCVDRAHR